MIATTTGIETVVNFVTMSGMIAGLIAMTGTAIVMIAGCMNNGEPTGMDIAGFTKTTLTLESEKRGTLVLRFFIGGKQREDECEADSERKRHNDDQYGPMRLMSTKKSGPGLIPGPKKEIKKTVR
jgi:hypothetical protein